MNPFTPLSIRNEHEPLSISIDEQNQPLNILFWLSWLVAPALFCSWASQPMQLRCWWSIYISTHSLNSEEKYIFCFFFMCSFMFSSFFPDHRTDNQRWVLATSVTFLIFVFWHQNKKKKTLLWMPARVHCPLLCVAACCPDNNKRLSKLPALTVFMFQMLRRRIVWECKMFVFIIRWIAHEEDCFFASQPQFALCSLWCSLDKMH